MANYLTEAFKQMEALDEDVFSITQEDGVEALDKFLDGDNTEDIELIVDPDAEKPEDIKDSYIGEVILQCPVCATKIYKSQEDIHIDDDTNMANVDEECPQCGTVGGFDIIGQIEEYTPDKEGAHEDEEDEHEEHEDDEHEEDEHEEEEHDEEDGKLEEAESPAKVDNRLDRARARLRKVRADDVADRTARAREVGLRESKVLKEAPLYDLSPRYDSRASFYNKARVDTGDEGDKNKLYSYNTLVAEIKDGKPVVYGTYSATTLRHIKEWLLQNGFKAENKAQIMRDYGVKVDESLEKVDIETEDQKVSMSSDADGKVTVTTEPKEVGVKTDEVIAPVKDEVKDEIIADEEEPSDEEDINVDIDEFDEEDFDTLGESYLKKVYDNVDSFKTTSGRLSENKMIFEGVISFNSGKKAKTSFIFEACDATKDGKVKFVGRNPQISKNNKAFTLKGQVKDKKFLSESFNYNYMGKDATTNKSRRVYGTIRKK